jgi:hypothetical protein
MTRLGSLGVIALLASSGCSLGRSVFEGVRFIGAGRAIALREARPDAQPSGPGLLVIAIDGAGRELLYDTLRSGMMPELAELIGWIPDSANRAHLDESLFATLPSSTAVAWATAFTGATPAQHGIVGNEFFLRETHRFVAPVPASVGDASDVLSIYTDDLVNDLLLAPTVYEQMREREPDIRIWVAMHQVFRGADLLLMPDRVALLDAFRVTIQEKLRTQLDDDDTSRVFEELDSDVVESVRDQLDEENAPDVLTVYLPGTDLYAHTSREGPDAARREYLSEVVDPVVGELAAALEDHGALRDRWVVVTSDHGHTQVIHEDHYSLGMDDEGEPGEVLESAGYRVRPFGLGASDAEDDFDAVLAYQGGLAYVYLADRSDCLERGEKCDWSRPPRLEEDVLPAAEAFYRTDLEGLHTPGMVDSLEMILVRGRGEEAPFRVYLGGGRLEDIDRHLEKHPRPHWPRFRERLDELGIGPGADRVGDLVLISRAGDEVALEQRRYFAPPYRSYHGSPAGRDSRIPLIVGHRTRTAAQAEQSVRRALAGGGDQAGVTRVLLELRAPAAEAR